MRQPPLQRRDLAEAVALGLSREGGVERTRGVVGMSLSALMGQRSRGGGALESGGGWREEGLL